MAQISKKDKEIEDFKFLASQGFNCKEIAQKMGYSTNWFGFKIKKLIGLYPSIYIARLKHGSP